MSSCITRLNHIGLQVRDLNIARKWFIDTLGLSECGATHDKFFVMAGDDVIAVEHHQDIDYCFDHYGFEAKSRESMDALYTDLLAQEIEFICHPHERRGGYSMTFRDPCGHIAEIQTFEKSTYLKSDKQFQWLSMEM